MEDFTEFEAAVLPFLIDKAQIAEDIGYEIKEDTFDDKVEKFRSTGLTLRESVFAAHDNWVHDILSDMLPGGQTMPIVAAEFEVIEPKQLSNG